LAAIFNHTTVIHLGWRSDRINFYTPFRLLSWRCQFLHAKAATAFSAS